MYQGNSEEQEVPPNELIQANVTSFGKKNNFKIAHINVRSLNTEFEAFSLYIHDHDFDIVAITETWLNIDNDSTLYSIPDYNFIRKDRETRGGGVAFYIKKNIKFSEIHSANFSTIETMCIEINIKKNKKLLCA